MGGYLLYEVRNAPFELIAFCDEKTRADVFKIVGMMFFEASTSVQGLDAKDRKVAPSQAAYLTYEVFMRSIPYRSVGGVLRDGNYKLEIQEEIEVSFSKGVTNKQTFFSTEKLTQRCVSLVSIDERRHLVAPKLQRVAHSPNFWQQTSSCRKIEYIS